MCAGFHYTVLKLDTVLFLCGVVVFFRSGGGIFCHFAIIWAHVYKNLSIFIPQLIVFMCPFLVHCTVTKGLFCD